MFFVRQCKINRFTPNAVTLRILREKPMRRRKYWLNRVNTNLLYKVKIYTLDIKHNLRIEQYTDIHIYMTIYIYIYIRMIMLYKQKCK